MTNGNLAERFESHRVHLRAVAYRMLGSFDEAEDAVQEAWLRLSRAGGDGIENLGGWLTTVVSRVCLDMLRSRGSRREEMLDAPDMVDTGTPDPSRDALLADTIGSALLVVLDTLSPAERIAFVLHDVFDLSFDDIAPIVERSPDAARQLASRARRRVQGASSNADDRVRRRRLVDAFLAASRAGDFSALLAVLDPDVIVRADGAAVHMGAAAEVRGAAAVAETFKGRAQGAQPAFLDGAPGLVWMASAQPRVAFRFTIRDERISAIDLVADPEHLAAMKIERLAQ
ncbi:MAG TPA: sigma-70 family RNA polymerase sigma factor [Vicinamibacterales bacterium]